MSTIDLTPASYRSAAEGTGDFDPAAPDRRSGSGMRRVLGMARANALLLTRNRQPSNTAATVRPTIRPIHMPCGPMPSPSPSPAPTGMPTPQ